MQLQECFSRRSWIYINMNCELMICSSWFIISLQYLQWFAYILVSFTSMYNYIVIIIAVVFLFGCYKCKWYCMQKVGLWIANECLVSIQYSFVYLFCNLYRATDMVFSMRALLLHMLKSYILIVSTCAFSRIDDTI